MASRKALPALRQSSLEAYRRPLATSSSCLSPDCAAVRADSSAASRCRRWFTPPSSLTFRTFLSFL
eukprot:scaffold25403_cov55-Phaeocystis_antarctica.AAC.3